jgi:hypothetical protein
MNDKNNLSFNISYKPIGQNVDMSTETFLYKGTNPLNTISSLTNTNLHSDETSVSLFYKKTFKKAVQEFTAEANYYWFNSKDGNYFTNTRYLYSSDLVLSTYARIMHIRLGYTRKLKLDINYITSN